MATTYLSGLAVGAVNGLLAIYLSMDSLRDWKTFAAVRSWPRRWWIALCLGALFGCYEIWLFGGLNRDFWCMLLLSGCMLSASLTDLASHEISVPGVSAYAVLLAVYQLSGLNVALCINALLGAGVGALILGLPKLLRPASVGGGDVLLLAVCGLGTGFPGIIYVLARSLLALALVSVVQLLRKKVEAKSEMPLAPCLLFGVLI